MGNKSLRNAPNANDQSGKEPRLLLLESWVEFEKENGDDKSMKKVEYLLPKRVKKRRKIESEDPDIDGQWEEYFDYIFPEDEGAKPNLKLLAMAKMWKKNKAEDSNVIQESSDEQNNDKSSNSQGESENGFMKPQSEDEEDIKTSLIKESEANRLAGEASNLMHLQASQNPDADDEEIKNESSSSDSSDSADSSSPSSADEGSDASDAKRHKDRLKRRRKRRERNEEQHTADQTDSSSSSDEDQSRSKKSKV